MAFDPTIVCFCAAVREERIREAIRAGARTIDQVGAECDAGRWCGGCRQIIRRMINDELGLPPPLEPPGAGWKPRKPGD